MEIRLSEILDGVESAVITLWHVAEQDKIEKGRLFVEIVTDKAAFDIDAPVDGTVLKILKKEGQKIKAHEVIAEILPREKKRRKNGRSE